MVSPLEMYSKYGLANRICSAKWGKLVRKWPMADCYFKLCLCSFLATYVQLFQVTVTVKVMGYTTLGLYDDSIQRPRLVLHDMTINIEYRDIFIA